MLTSMKKNLGLLLAVATLSAATVLVPSTAGAAASIVPNAGTSAATDPHTKWYVRCMVVSNLVNHDSRYCPWLPVCIRVL